MKLYTYQKGDGMDRIGVGLNAWRGLLWPIEAFGLSFTDMNDLIRRLTPAQLLRLSDPAQPRETHCGWTACSCAPRFRIRSRM